MNLASLKSILEDTTNTQIGKVVFDFSTILNSDFEKEYPYILWDLDNSKWTQQLRAEYQTVVMDCFILGEIEENTQDKITIWDEIELKLIEYINNLNNSNRIAPVNNEITKEYYPMGLLSVDGEVGIRYNITLKVWC
jgi:hypothetical protein